MDSTGTLVRLMSALAGAALLAACGTETRFGNNPDAAAPGVSPDTTPPTINIVSPVNASTTTSARITLAGTAADDTGVAQVRWSSDRGGSGLASGTTSWTATNVPLLQGTNVLTVTAVDAAGNSTSATVSVQYNDITGPTVVSTFPGGTNVPVGSSITVTFDEPLDPTTVDATTFTVSGVTGSVSVNGVTARFVPAPPGLAANTTYTVTVRGGPGGVTDVVGNPLAGDVSWTFTTSSSGSVNSACDGFYGPGFQLVSGFDNTPMPSFPRPAKGVPYTDPTYGTCVVRVTDAANEPPPTFARNDYSRRQAFNADDSLILVYAYDGSWHLYDARTLQYVKKLRGPGGDAEPQWDPQDPNILYYLPNKGGMSIRKVDVVTDTVTIVADFTQPDSNGFRIRDLWPTAARLWTKSEGSPSRDLRYWAFVVQDANFNFLGLMSYDLQTNTILGTFSGPEEPNNVSMSISGSHVVAQYSRNDRPIAEIDQGGPVAFSRDFSSYTFLRPGGLVSHTDLALDAAGNDVLVGVDHGNGYAFFTDLQTGLTTDLFYIWGSGASAMHFSGRSYNKPGWAVVSVYGGSGDWLHNKVFVVELAANPRIYHLAHHHRGSGGYFTEVHASTNRDLTRIVFNSNWGGNDLTQVDTYMIEIPASSVP